MKDYNPVSMMLNMPCQYIEVDTDKSKDFSTEVLVGHFAFYDEDGYGYVWSNGGTSYTRATNFTSSSTLEEYIKSQLTVGAIVKCKHVFPLSTNVHEYYKHKNLVALIKPS